MYKYILIIFIWLSASNLNAAAEPAIQFITLGTAGGPQGNGMRAQPANALLNGENVWLVDAGDGITSQLAKADINLSQVKVIFLSHLHFDHTGGVLAVLGLRSQMEMNELLTIYGPPGTGKFIEGLRNAMSPVIEAGNGFSDHRWQSSFYVQEISDGTSLEISGVKVAVTENSHYVSGEIKSTEEGLVSLSFRFDTSNRSIVYSGDTGPSKAVTNLSNNADFLIIEMMDGPVVLNNIRRFNPSMNETLLIELERHFSLHHLSPVQVAELAANAKVKTVVVTHFMPGVNSPEQESHYRSIMQKHFDGEIIFANDLDKF